MAAHLDVADPVEVACKDVSTLSNLLVQKTSLARPFIFSKLVWEKAENSYSGNCFVFIRQSLMDAIIANLFRLLSFNTDERGLAKLIDLLNDEVSSPSDLTDRWVDCRKNIYRDDEAENFLPSSVSELTTEFDALKQSDRLLSLRAFRNEEVAHFLRESKQRKKLRENDIELKKSTYDDVFCASDDVLKLASNAYLLGTLVSYDFGVQAYRFYAQEWLGEYFGVSKEDFRSHFPDSGDELFDG